MTTVERTPVIPVGTLYPCCACLCCMNSLVCRNFDCVGIYSRDACCCIQVDNYCCKYTNEPGYDCIVYRSECMKGDCRACCQVSQNVRCHLFTFVFDEFSLFYFLCRRRNKFAALTSDVKIGKLTNSPVYVQCCSSRYVAFQQHNTSCWVA